MTGCSDSNWVGELTGRSGTTSTSTASWLGVLLGGSVAGTLAGRAGAARAAWAGDGVLGWSLVAGAVEGGLFATRALCLLSCKSRTMQN